MGVSIASQCSNSKLCHTMMCEHSIFQSSRNSFLRSLVFDLFSTVPTFTYVCSGLLSTQRNSTSLSLDYVAYDSFKLPKQSSRLYGMLCYGTQGGQSFGKQSASGREKQTGSAQKCRSTAEAKARTSSTRKGNNIDPTRHTRTFVSVAHHPSVCYERFN